MIIRGTTPYHNFMIPMKSSDIAALYVTYTQNGEEIIDKSSKTEGDLSIENYQGEASMYGDPGEQEEPDTCQVTLHLTQEDTLGFKFYPAARKNIAVIQVRILTTDGEAYVSDPVTDRIFGVLHDGVITGGE